MWEAKKWKSFKWRKKIKIIISGRVRHSILLNMDVVFAKSCVFSERRDPHSLKHTFFHKNQWASTLRPSHIWGVKLATEHRKPKQSQTSSFHPFLGGKKSKKLYLKIMALLKTPICELIRGSLKEKIPSSGKTWVVFIGMVTVHSHWTINCHSLSLLGTKKWQVGDDWSRLIQGTVACHDIIWEWWRNTIRHYQHHGTFLRDAQKW